MLDLTAVGTDAFKGIGTGGETTMCIFGGHVITQALRAAYLTLEMRLRHCLKRLFYPSRGDPAVPVIYHVKRTRDGGSFTTRRIVARQQVKEILTMSASV